MTAAPRAPRGADDRYRSIVEQQTDLISRVRADGTLVYVNEAYCRYFGRAREELIGRRWQPVAHPEDVADIEAALATLTPDDPVAVVENRVVVAGGAMRWCQFVNTATFDAAGRVIEYQSVGRDVSERKTLELRLAAAVAETTDLYDNAPCGYWSLDAQGRFVRISATALAWLGRTRDELLGKARAADFFDADGVALFEREFPDFLRTGVARELEFRIHGADGQTRHISLSATAVRDAEGRFVMSRSVAFDITALRRTQEQLRELSLRQGELLEAATHELRMSQARLRAIFDSAMDAIVTVDRSQVVVDANPAAAALFGRPLPELLGAPLASLIPERFRERHAVDVRAFADDRVDSRTMGRARPVIGLRADGSEFPVEASISRVSVEGELLYTVIMRDITQRVQAEQALLAGRAKLEAALASMTDAACTADAQGRLLEFNDAFVAFHRCASRQQCAAALGGPSSMLQIYGTGGRPLPPEDWPIPRALRGEVGSGVEFTLRRADSGQAWVGSYSFAPIRDQTGQILGAVLTARDVTDLRRIEADLKSSQEDLRRLIMQRDRAQEDERRRIALELHDDLQQTLATIHLDVAAVQELLPPEAAAARALLDDLDELASGALRSTRRIVADLRPPALDDLGLVAALEALVDRANRHSGLAHTFRCDGVAEDSFAAAPEVATCLYRVAQEALNNVAKHAQARRVTIELQRRGDGSIALRIRDDGRGLEPRGRGELRTLGLLGMQERARSVGGSLGLSSAPGQGTTVELVVPLPPARG